MSSLQPLQFGKQSVQSMTDTAHHEWMSRLHSNMQTSAHDQGSTAAAHFHGTLAHSHMKQTGMYLPGKFNHPAIVAEKPARRIQSSLSAIEEN